MEKVHIVDIVTKRDIPTKVKLHFPEDIRDYFQAFNVEKSTARSLVFSPRFF